MSVVIAGRGRTASDHIEGAALWLFQAGLSAIGAGDTWSAVALTATGGGLAKLAYSLRKPASRVVVAGRARLITSDMITALDEAAHG